MADRHLSKAELSLCQQVFAHTIPYGKVLITDNIGWGNRPFTTPSPYPWNWGTYYINMGKTGYRSCMSTDEWKACLIHEMTHVWQGFNSGWNWNYVFNSCWHQLASGLKAYDYEPLSHTSMRWGSFNVEQQAKIVEDWFRGRMSHHDIRYPFIRDNILKRHNS